MQGFREGSTRLPLGGEVLSRRSDRSSRRPPDGQCASASSRRRSGSAGCLRGSVRPGGGSFTLPQRQLWASSCTSASCSSLASPASLVPRTARQLRRTAVQDGSNSRSGALPGQWPAGSSSRRASTGTEHIGADGAVRPSGWRCNGIRPDPPGRRTSTRVQGGRTGAAMARRGDETRVDRSAFPARVSRGAATRSRVPA